MLCTPKSRVLFLLQSVFCLAACHVEFFHPDNFQFPRTEQDRFIRSRPGLSVVHPEKVDKDGQFVSFSLTHHFSHGQNIRDLVHSEKYVYYRVPFRGLDLTFNLTINRHLLSNEYVLERRLGGSNGTQDRRVSKDNACHLVGSVTHSSFHGTAAMSTCEGLKGFFALPNGDYFIEPVQYVTDGEEGLQPHVIYQSSVRIMPHRHRRSSGTEGNQRTCGVRDGPTDSLRAERKREAWEREQGKQRPRLIPRSVSRERWVETMVVADSKLIQYHGSDNVESYIFTIMNMVTGIFHDASIGNAIHIVLVRLILLQEEEKGLKIVHHADSTLSSFCAWQKTVNPRSDTHPAHHDVAVLITRKDLCAGMNKPCETLGLSHLSGMCQPHRSCNINEDSGLPVAFTVAHELGHSFGIPHDGQGNDCELEGRHPFIMSRQLQYDTSPLTWSACSKDYITRFLDRGWGSCLDDRPSKKDLSPPVSAPGVRYSIHNQCQLQYGPNASFCPEVENVCQILWCSVNGSCRSKLDSPADGTQCAQDKWCISGECIIVGKLPETVNGGWGVWSAWSHCSRTCGAGVQAAERECNRPKPEFGGRYCTGERKRYRICNTKPCAKQRPTFREMQCSEFDTVPHQNQLYQWIPVSSTANPCELHCRPVDEEFSEKMLEAVTDGTPCFQSSDGRSVCINGVCKEVGCDYGIDSNAIEDRCGVCLGDGSTCQTIRKSFEGGESFGYVDVGLIPQGARDIVVQEVAEATNFLVLRGQDPEEYYLNGRYIIQWNGEYTAGGATFFYERSGDLENLTSPGPTKEPVMIQLLFQEKNPGIRYEYTIRKSRPQGNWVPEYRWKHGAWTDCSATCGSGWQNQPVRCFEAEVGVVEESLCDSETRPDNRQRKCKKMDCPARWWVGGWQPCSSSCGPTGMKKRTVLCVRTVAGEERVLPPGDCRKLLKPKPLVPCNRECSVSCGGGVRSRSVTCLTASRSGCNILLKPRSRSLCGLQSCPSSRRKAPPHSLIPTSDSQFPATVPNISTTTVAITTVNSNLLPRATPPDVIDSVTERSVGENEKEGDQVTLGPIATTDMVTEVTQEDEGSTPDTTLLCTGAGFTLSLDYITEDSEVVEEEPIVGVSFPTEDPPTTLRNQGLSTMRFHATPPNPIPSNRPVKEHVLTTTALPRITQAPLWGPGNLGSTRTSDPPITARVQKVGFRGTLEPLTHSYNAGLDAYPPVHMAVFWVAGNWSQCSTTCGLGAVWRTVTCSSGQETDCAALKRPEPARTCLLRPCATWHSSNWSKCPDGCQGGVQQRSVLCVDSQTGRQLRPYHCQALAHSPPSSLPCPVQPCLDWILTPWGKCSRSCGEGMRERLVYCPEHNRCDPTQKPANVEPCDQHHCGRWTTDPWEECTVSCGGGVQHRVVKCMEEVLAREEGSQCDRRVRPNSFQKCNLQDCRRSGGPWCAKDSMSARFCEKLKLLGRCSLGSIRKQCCVTCRGSL